jgi:hypothetical protein
LTDVVLHRPKVGGTAVDQPAIEKPRPFVHRPDGGGERLGTHFMAAENQRRGTDQAGSLKGGEGGDQTGCGAQPAAKRRQPERDAAANAAACTDQP